MVQSEDIQNNWAKFFEDRIISERYMEQILPTFQVANTISISAFFQQD
jgi:hypothetical protein